MTKGSPLQRSCRQPPGTRARGLRASSPPGCVAEYVKFKGWVSRCDPGGHTERRSHLEAVHPQQKKKKTAILSFCAGGPQAGVNQKKQPPQARQELQGAEPREDLPETPTGRLPDPEAATSSMPSDEFPGRHGHLGEAPRVPSPQERGRARWHRPGLFSSVQPTGTGVSCVPACTEWAWPWELMASRDLSATSVLSMTLTISSLWLLSPCLVDGQPRLGPRGL